MKKTISSGLAAISFLLLTGCGNSNEVLKGTPQTASNEKEAIEQAVSEEEIAETLSYLASDELQGRKTGTEGIEKAAKYIEQVFQEHGVQPYFDTYRDAFEVQGLAGFNVIGLVEGTDPSLRDEYIIIGAHYDHIGQGKLVGEDSLANGANDNASGTTAVIELAKYFSQNPTGRSLLFTLFSAEELGLVGAKELAKSLKAKGIDLYTMFNIEMIGVPMNGRNYKAYITGYENSNMAKKFNEYSGEEVIGFLPEAKAYNLFKRSDNYPFFEEFNVPAQTISTFDFTNYDFYHHVDDEFEQMDVNHIEELIEAIIPGVAAMANTQTKEIKLN